MSFYLQWETLYSVSANFNKFFLSIAFSCKAEDIVVYGVVAKQQSPPILDHVTYKKI